MRAYIYKLLSMKHFFTVVQFKDKSVKFWLKQPSLMLMQNIHYSWLQDMLSRTQKVPVYLDESYKELCYIPGSYGAITQDVQHYCENTLLELFFSDSLPIQRCNLKLDLYVPPEDAMQCFIRWQRYRKYWWSSISVTPSRFSVSEFRYIDKTAQVDVLAKLPFGDHPIECITMFQDHGAEKKNCLRCEMFLEDALFALLLDGLTTIKDPYCNKEELFIRLHRKMAPYKISFALDVKETSAQRDIIIKIAKYLHHKMNCLRVSSYLPDFSLPYDLQLKENQDMAISYTAILDEDTLKYGIFNLLHGGTHIKEKFHVTDFHRYAAVVFENL